MKLKWLNISPAHTLAVASTAFASSEQRASRARPDGLICAIRSASTD